MTYTISGGSLVAIHKPTYQAPTSVRLSEDYTADYAAIYASQPEVRVVVDFIARNIAQLALQTFRRVGDNDRKRLQASDSPVAAILARPNPFTTTRRLIRDTISDRGIYDRALWVKAGDGDGNAWLVRMPPALWDLDPEDTNWLTPSRFKMKGSVTGRSIDAKDAVYFRGYNPHDARRGLSPIESLRRTLSEEYAASAHREQTLRNGARLSGYIKRPKDATWSDEAADRFKAGWRSQYQGWSATEGGGTPVLEDGMEFISVGQNAVDLQYVESRKLTREEVAAAYFIPPPMIGILDHATFSNITEQHKMLYQDTLGPHLVEFQDELGLQLIDDLDNSGQVYVEFNMMEKLKGSFEEQAAQLSTSVGAPWLTRNEARARQNLSPVEGGDELVVPLNVLVGGQAYGALPAGTDEEIVDAEVVVEDEPKAIPRRRVMGVKARPSGPEVAKATQLLSKFFEKQAGVVMSQLGAKAPWWNSKRWDSELTTVLFALGTNVSEAVAKRTIAKLGADADSYNVDQTLAYLQTVAAATAKRINTVTEQELKKAIESDDDDAPAAVFEKARTSRAAQSGVTFTTGIAGFGSAEAAKQAAGTRTPVKTWQVTSSNPRSSHSAMNGETVGIDDTFSNGMKWPGDSTGGDADEVAGCECDLVISYEGSA